jgi:hypothetical protein
MIRFNYHLSKTIFHECWLCKPKYNRHFYRIHKNFLVIEYIL